MTTTPRRLLSLATTALLLLLLAQPASAAPDGPSVPGGGFLGSAWASLAELTAGLFGGSLERIAAEEGHGLDPNGAPTEASSNGEEGHILDPNGNSAEGEEGHIVDPDG